MNTWTRIGLVLLRVVIGWHFLFEGLEKVDSWYHGPREGKPVWSAEPYLRESQGPLAWWFRQQLGDPDQEALAMLTLPEGATHSVSSDSGFTRGSSITGFDSPFSQAPNQLYTSSRES